MDLMEDYGRPEELRPLSAEPVTRVWPRLPASANAVAVIVEPIGSYVGKEVILHALPNLHAIAVRRVYSSNRVLLDSMNISADQLLSSSTIVVFLDRRHPTQMGLISERKLFFFVEKNHFFIPLCWVTSCIHSGIIPVGQFSPKCAKSINQA